MIGEPKIHVILHSPQIPQNTGNIGRMCAITGARLHLIHPLGFIITDAKLKRSGMDYWHTLDVHHHANWEAFAASALSPKLERIWLLTTKSASSLFEAKFEEGDGILFGSEDRGVPLEIHEKFTEKSIKIPHYKEGFRSLNLSTAAGIATYEAMRQISLK